MSLGISGRLRSRDARDLDVGRRGCGRDTMGWWPWGGKEKQPDMSVGSRTVCYDHRDNYFACLGASCPHSLLACLAAYRCASV